MTSIVSSGVISNVAEWFPHMSKNSLDVYVTNHIIFTSNFYYMFD